MSEVDRIVEAFDLFNEKVDKLTRLSFVTSTLESGSGVTLSWKAIEGGGYEGKHERRGPAEEAIDAFVHTFRYFIQDNETSSLRMMAGHYNAAPLDDNELKEEFADVRKQINDFLDGKSDFPIEYNGEVLTRRKIMDTFVYGGLSHATDPKIKRLSDKKRLYDEWMGIPPFRLLIENEFVCALAKILDALVYIKTVNEKALAQLVSAKAV